MSEKPKTYRSYGMAKIDDNFRISLNIKWLVQIIFGIGIIVLGYIRIEELVSKHMVKEEKERNQMEERISFFEKELNLNPFSWKRKKK